jgi:endonuclease/exonuclease/phosphatase family metal-dependent hydrolase
MSDRRREGAHMFSVLTWNVENLYRPGGEFGPASEQVYTAKLDHLAAIITGVGADVLALQEIGDPVVLADLRQHLGGGWPHAAVSDHPDQRGIRVAILARHPISGPVQLHAFPDAALDRIPTPDRQLVTTLGRGVLQATVTPSAGPPVRVVTAHLKSKLLSFPGNRRFPRNENERARGAGYALLRRTGEAVAVRVHLNDQMTDDDTPTVLLGDLNDEPGAVTTQLLQGPEDGDPKRPDKGDDVRLYNLADRLAAGRAYSRVYKKRQELIDHILVSRELLFTVTQVDSLVEGIASITESVDTRREAAVPDHAPVFARFELP